MNETSIDPTNYTMYFAAHFAVHKKWPLSCVQIDNRLLDGEIHLQYPDAKSNRNFKTNTKNHDFVLRKFSTKARLSKETFIMNSDTFYTIYNNMRTLILP